MTDVQTTIRNAPNPQHRQRGVTVVDPSKLDFFIDPIEAAGILSVSPKCIRDRIKAGQIPAVKCGRVWRIPRDKFLRLFEIVEG